MRLPKPSRVSPSPKLNNTSRMFSLIDVVFPSPNTSAVSVEPVKLLSSVRLSVDGPRSPSDLSWDLWTTLKPMATPRIWRTWWLITFRLTVQPKVAEELTALTVESVPTCLPKLTFSCTQLRRLSTSRRKARPSRSLRVRFPSERNDDETYLNWTIFFSEHLRW